MMRRDTLIKGVIEIPQLYGVSRIPCIEATPVATFTQAYQDVLRKVKTKHAEFQWAVALPMTASTAKGQLTYPEILIGLEGTLQQHFAGPYLRILYWQSRM